jgi:hypothetical protein
VVRANLVGEQRSGELFEPVPGGWERLPETLYAGDRLSRALGESGIANDAGGISVHPEVFVSVLPSLLRLGESWRAARSVTFAMSVDYAEPQLTVEFDAPVVASLAALGIGIDVDCYPMLGPLAEEPAFSPAVHQLGIALAHRPGLDLPPERLVATTDGWMSARTKKGGLVGNHIGRFLQPFAPWRGILFASAALGICTVWCESSGGWGRPGLVVTARQLQAAAAVGARLRFSVLVRPSDSY